MSAPTVIAAQTLAADLADWYGRHCRKLPWRETRDPYAIWVSEVMAQQTRIETVLPYYRRFMARFPRIADLARSELDPVLKLWEGLGYYARARNLHRAARLVVASHHGRLPDDTRAIRELPGIGPYIAAAILSIAFGRPLAVVDGNVKRVLARLLEMPQPVNRPGSQGPFQQAAEQLLDPHHPGRHNQAMMELGALVCRPRNPECPVCPVSRHCRAFARDAVSAYPRREKRPATPLRHLAAGVVWRDGRVLVTRRPLEGLLGGLWAFPAGPVPPSTPAAAACRRHIRSATGLTVEIGPPLTRVRHAYTHFRIDMAVFACRYVSGPLVLDGPTEARWVPVAELARLALPRAHRKIAAVLPADEMAHR